MKTLALLASVAIVAGMARQSKDPVGHWKLDDEKTSATSADSGAGRNAGVLKNGPTWSAGKIGGALAFDGKDDYVEIPNTKELENVQEGSFTLAAWFKPENVPPGTESANDAQYAIVVKSGWHVGLHYSNEKKFTLAYFTMGETEPAWAGTGAYDTDYEPGSWYHVVGVVDKGARVAKIYIDGELKGTGEEWAEGAKTREYEQTTWKIGAAGPGYSNWAWHAKASIDDVRIYARALSDAEVAEIHKAGEKK